MIKIGTFFGIVVLSGQEKRVQKRLQQSIISHDISGVYALDKYFCFETNYEKEIVDVLNMNEFRLTNHLRLLQMKEHIELLQSAIHGTELSDWQRVKVHDELVRLEKEIIELKPKKQMLMLRGYVLIETKEDYTELPNELYTLLKEIEGVTKISSKLPIPAEEMGHFFKRNLDLQQQLESFYSIQQNMQDVLTDLLEHTEVYM